MEPSERFREMQKMGFRIPAGEGNLLSDLTHSVELVVVEGLWDEKQQQWVDPPVVTSGFGMVCPDAVVEKFGIIQAQKYVGQ